MDGKTVNSDGGGTGADGFSPVIIVTPIEGGHNVSITDKTGTKTFNLINGEKGDTGEQGPKGDKGEPGEQGPKGDKGRSEEHTSELQSLG